MDDVRHELDHKHWGVCVFVGDGQTGGAGIVTHNKPDIGTQQSHCLLQVYLTALISRV